MMKGFEVLVSIEGAAAKRYLFDTYEETQDFAANLQEKAVRENKVSALLIKDTGEIILTGNTEYQRYGQVEWLNL